jgi:hypothetical protein
MLLKAEDGSCRYNREKWRQKGLRDGRMQQSVVSFGVKPYVLILYVVYSVVVVDHLNSLGVFW